MKSTSISSFSLFILFLLGIGIFFFLYLFFLNPTFSFFYTNKVETLDTLETLDIPTEPLFLTVPNDFLNTNLAKDFCKTFQNANSLNAGSGSESNSLGSESNSLGSESNSLENSCSKLTFSNCVATDCCVLLNGKTCVSGSQNGPTYLTDSSGTKINMDYYYYQGKCYGNNCPT